MKRGQLFLPLDAQFEAQNKSRPVPRQLPLALEAAAPFSVDNYIIGAANRAAFEMLESWPRWPGPVTVLIGAPKTGKSHLAAVWAAQAYAMQCAKDRLDKAAELAARGTPILLEDIDRGGFDETQLFHLINTVRQAWSESNQAALLITARTRPAAWKIHLADLASRLRAANLLELGEADDALRQAVLAKLFADKQLRVEADIMRFILNRSERSPAQLMAVAERLDRLALERKSRISRALAAEVLAELEAEAESGAAPELPAVRPGG